jgi:hypothetical protein
MKSKKTQINGKTFHFHGLIGLIELKVSYYPKQSTESNVIPIKIQMPFFEEIRKNPKFLKKSKGTP